MIVLKLLEFSNVFSYGADNCIDFSKNPLTQLVGKNGHGKSSIALILEEVLFNKNSKGIKKGDILNRHAKEKQYTIKLTLEKDDKEYKIETKRGSSQTVKLYENSVDISSHTATATYKQIENLIGMDHKTFSQIVYQSNAGSLEFLTSPDTARKKFLIELLGLNSYIEAGEVFKQASSEINKELSAVQGKLDTVTQWLKKYESIDLAQKPIIELPDLPDNSEIEKLNVRLLSIAQNNKQIAQNNTYKTLEAKAKAAVLPEVEIPSEDENIYVRAMAKAATQYDTAKAFIAKMSKLHGTCPTCLSSIDTAKVAELIAEHTEVMKSAEADESIASEKVKKILHAKAVYEKAKQAQAEWEKYCQLINPELPTELEDASELEEKITLLQNQVADAKRLIADIEKRNKDALAHNSKIAVIEGQVKEMQDELEVHSAKLKQLTDKLNTLSILVKTFSTTGLVAYKIENLVKDLEELTNSYLGELSGGRFQIAFQISGSDKLNVVVTDNGTDIDICALSGGERARVNVATLLAIRRLMQSLSKSKINLLILDETVESLDLDGKEKLIEVLLEEDSLNTVLVSHSFSHPLIEKIHIVKTNNISKIEE